jgi:translation initiation factor IF-3
LTYTSIFFSFILGGVNIKQELPINEKIRFKEVQVIDEQGQKLGVMSSNDALDIALDKKLDLVLVAPNGNPPVCKIMNYGKYKFEQAKKEKEAKKKQKTSEIKEIRITPNTEDHDFNFKAKNARKFLTDGAKVKITVRFRGRELNYAKAGEDLLNKFAEELSDIANVDKKPSLEGKNMFIILSTK